mmetsp:Transcript_9325/g.14278  ORF Transcript_9325/g.14278 Transcript_9325/m.14278 type:complete len:96 (-) Transcript_9325:113-400(-)
MFGRLLLSSCLPHGKGESTNEGEWTYPAREVVLEEVELYTLREYIDRRRKLLGLTGLTSGSGSAPSSIFVGKVRDDAVLRRWWWDQPIDTDLESE